MQVYLALGSPTSVMIGMKRLQNDWWQGRQRNMQQVNGGGDYCLPGGRCDRRENPIRAAYRELAEETGIIFQIPQPIIQLINNSYSLYYIGVSEDQLTQFVYETNVRLAANPPRVKDWELAHVEAVSKVQLDSKLGVAQPGSHHSQDKSDQRHSIDWYGEIAMKLSNFGGD